MISLTCLSFSCHPCLMPLSLDPVCACHLWILTVLAVDSSGARDLTHFSLLTIFFPYSPHFTSSFTPLSPSPWHLLSFHQTHWHSAVHQFIDLLESRLYSGKSERNAKSGPHPSHKLVLLFSVKRSLDFENSFCTKPYIYVYTMWVCIFLYIHTYTYSENLCVYIYI